MRKITFIHISDVLLGTDTDMNMSWGEERKKEIYETFENIIFQAEDRKVDFLFIAGNLFDHKPTEEELRWLDNTLSGLTGTSVVYVAGPLDNLGGDAPVLSYEFHSPIYVAGSPNVAETVCVRDVQATMALDLVHFPEKQVDIYGISYFDKKMDAALVEEAVPLEGSTCSILVANGGAKHRMPIDWNKMRGSAFDYIALGGRQKYWPGIHGKIYYSGSPEAVSAESAGVHGYIYGEIEDGKVTAELIPASIREYKTIDYPVDNHTKNSTLSRELCRILEMEGKQNIYTVNIVRAAGCEKNFDVAGDLVGYRVLAVNGEHFERTDYSEYIRANRNTEFGELIREMDISELEDREGIKLAVDTMIEMSGVYSRNNKRMSGDVYSDTRRQVIGLFSSRLQIYENDGRIQEYKRIRDDYSVSPDVLDELNSVWARERGLELEIKTLRRHIEELPRQYKQRRVRGILRAVLVPFMIFGIAAIILFAVLAAGHKGEFAGERMFYIAAVAVGITLSVIYIGTAVIRYWSYKKKGKFRELDGEAALLGANLNELCLERDRVHIQRTDLQKLDGRRREMYDKMTESEKVLDAKLRDMKRLATALNILQ